MEWYVLMFCCVVFLVKRSVDIHTHNFKTLEIGTVMDVYYKITIGYAGKVTQKRPTNRGVRTVLGGGTSDVCIAFEGQMRVLVTQHVREEIWVNRESSRVMS